MGPRPASAPRAPAPAPRARLEAEARALTPRRASATGIGSNVLLFVAILCGIGVAIYVMNKDAPKTVSPFEASPGMGAPPARAEPTAAPDPSRAVRGTVRLSDDSEGAPSGILFVIVRSAGQAGGPPLAVRRFERPEFPLAFAVGPEHMMIQGRPFVGPLVVEARLDTDGNAMTRQPTDLSARPVSGIEPGATDIALILERSGAT